MDCLIEMILMGKYKEAKKEYNKFNIKTFHMMNLIECRLDEVAARMEIFPSLEFEVEI